MTRLKLISWLAIPALLVVLGLVPHTATAAAPQEEGEVIYLPMGEQPEWLKQGLNSGLKTSAAGEVTTSQFGVADAVVSNTNGMLSVRFDPPYNAPYTITGISFPTRTQFQIPTTPGSFISVRILGMNATTGLPDKSIEYFQQRRVLVSSTGGMNTIPLNIAGSPGQTFFAVFQFPRPPASADTFPFLFTDRNLTDRGLYANSYTTDTNAVIRTAPATLGTFTGTAVFADQNIVVSMTCQLSGAVPMNAPPNAGLNLRDIAAEWTFGPPDNTVLADGTPAGNTKTNIVQLLSRGLTWGFVTEAGVQSGKVPLPSVPGSGMQIWGLRGRSTNGTVTDISNVTITGPASVVGYSGWSEDADEANGKDSDVEAATVTPPFTGRPETLWPAGDIDNYTFFAQPGQVISVTATPVGNDFRSDMSLVVNLLENNHDVIESQIGGAGAAVSFQAVAPAPSGNSGSQVLKRFFVQVYDRNGSPDDPSNWNRVLIPATYNLDVDVFSPAPNLISDDPSLSGAVGSDEFAFANAGSNPAHGRATFSYVIPKSKGEASVKLRVYDVRGRLMTTLVNGSKGAGTHFASWSGHDQRGNRVASGPYFARIDAGSYSRTVRIVMN